MAPWLAVLAAAGLTTALRGLALATGWTLPRWAAVDEGPRD